jgi:hypothetical protein
LRYFEHVLKVLAAIKSNLYIPHMALRKRASESEWEVFRLSARGERLGVVVATDQDAALKAAIKSFVLPREENDRLLVRPR